jgi:hypothetical protein
MSSSVPRRSPRIAAKLAKKNAHKIKVPRGTLKYYTKSILGLSLEAWDAELVIQEIMDDIAEYITDLQVCNAYVLLLAAQEYGKQMDEDHIAGVSSSKALQAKMFNLARKAYLILEQRFVE